MAIVDSVSGSNGTFRREVSSAEGREITQKTPQQNKEVPSAIVIRRISYIGGVVFSEHSFSAGMMPSEQMEMEIDQQSSLVSSNI